MPESTRPRSPFAPAAATPHGIPSAALWTAAAHAAECLRPAPIVRDPWAADFLHAAGFDGGPPGDGPLQRLLPDWQVVRTRFFDDYALAAARSGCRQVVLLGAGLDTRAFRLDWPTGVHVFEVEDAAVLAFKEYVLDWSRLSCGRAPSSKPTARHPGERNSGRRDSIPAGPPHGSARHPCTSSGRRRWRPSSP